MWLLAYRTTRRTISLTAATISSVDLGNNELLLVVCPEINDVFLRAAGKGLAALFWLLVCEADLIAAGIRSGGDSFMLTFYGVFGKRGDIEF